MSPAPAPPAPDSLHIISTPATMSTDPKNPTQKFLVVIGAGISGIVSGAEAHRKGVMKNPQEEMVIFERSSGFGGVWAANTYPGAACDIVSHIYSISWFPKYDWSRRYSPQEEIRRYYDHIAHYYNLDKSAKFNHTVLSAHWSDTDLHYNVTVKNELTGTLYYYTCNVLLSAIGQLNRAKRARIPGADTFTGPQFHTAEWDHTVDLTGKRVAIIGTGPSAGQVIPSIAEKVKHLHVYQRSPPHIMPRDDYVFPKWVNFLFSYVPFVQWFHHLYLYYQGEMAPYRSVHLPSQDNAAAEAICQAHMESQIPASRPDLRKAFTPSYAFGCKRPLFLDTYYPTFLRDNVSLHTSPPTSIGADTVTTTDGTAEVDVIIWATGFLTQDVLGHIDIRGHQGVRLKEQWGSQATAYLGTSTHNFPNLFMIYGPATGLLWGSLTFMFETQAIWCMKVISRIYGEQKRGKRVAFAVPEDTERKYNEEVQEKLKGLALNDPRCSSFYKNEKGVVTTNFPWRLADYWRRLLWVEWRLYERWEKVIGA
ncbi:hypothetical protein EDC01DRAFT_705575 [Geopyxis carbonaria]|nr:hypothetical protein EDC01DRAFT_705575 [Geopyxis carbonaria]